jgi:hypothetical protein
MPRSLHLFATSALVLAVSFCLPGHGQDSPSPSLGDPPRQAQTQKDKDKDKSKAAAKKVFTNDDFASGTGAASSGAGSGPGHTAQQGVQPSVQPGSASAPATAAASASASPSDQLAQIGSLLGQLDSLDRATLATNVLEGNDTDFSGRSAWEDRLFAAKQAFVAQEHEIMVKASQMNASEKGAGGMQNPNDPRTKALSDQLDQLMKEAARSSETFQAVAAEGKELADESSAH